MERPEALLARWSPALPVAAQLGYPPAATVITVEELAEEVELFDLVLGRWCEQLGLRGVDGTASSAGAALLTDVATAVLAVPAVALTRGGLRWSAGADAVALAFADRPGVHAVGWLAPQLGRCQGCDLAELLAGARLGATLAPLAAAVSRRCRLESAVVEGLLEDAAAARLSAALAVDDEH